MGKLNTWSPLHLSSGSSRRTEYAELLSATNESMLHGGEGLFTNLSKLMSNLTQHGSWRGSYERELAGLVSCASTGTPEPPQSQAPSSSPRLSSLYDRPVAVMVVEDDAADRRLYRRALESTHHPYVISEFSYATEALEAIPRVQPECILLDFNLPDLDGMRFLRHLEEQTEADAIEYPSVVMLTAFESRGLGVQALKAGASDFLSKHELDVTSLEVAVHRAVREYDSRKLRARVRRVEKMAAIGQIAAGVAHEVNNPATFIMANLDLIQNLLDLSRDGDGIRLDAGASQELTEMLSDCVAGIERIATIVGELRSQTHPRLEQISRSSLDDVVESAYRLLKPRDRTKLPVVQFELEARSPFNVDRGKLVQMVSNLIVNAIHAAGEGGAVRVKTYEHDASAYLSVSDSGPGVPHAVRRRMFEPFFTTKEDKLGMGMGLALCADYVEKHGGTIAVSDSPIGGAMFQVRLPFDNGLRAPAESPPRRPSLPLVSAGKRVKILAVDDELAILRAYERILGSNFDVTVSSRPEEALQLLIHGAFDVVLCDVVMPETDGFELFDRAKAQMKALPRFVFCTGGAMDEDVHNRLIERAVERLEKPLNATRLLDLLRNPGEQSLH